MDEQRSVRDAAIEQTVTTLIYIGLMLGASWALAHRDEWQRLGARAAAWWRDQSPADEPTVAEFRRDVSAWDHGERER